MSAQVEWFDRLAPATRFTFVFSSPPDGPFLFNNPRTAPFESTKRRRPLCDVDGTEFLGKKKRRLRLNLITSRLSKPFSSPASNVADHGIKKVTVWKRGCGTVPWVAKDNLRKMAVMNCVKNQVEEMKMGAEKRRREMMLPPPIETPVQTHAQLMCQMALRDIPLVKPRTPETSPSLPPSPLGLSNYDALDLEDEDFGISNWSDEEGSDDRMGFNTCSISTSRSTVKEENYDFLDEMDGIPPDGVDVAQHEAPQHRWWGF